MNDQFHHIKITDAFTNMESLELAINTIVENEEHYDYGKREATSLQQVQLHPTGNPPKFFAVLTFQDWEFL